MNLRSSGQWGPKTECVIAHRPETPKPDPPVPNEPDTGEGDGITDYQS